MTCRKGDNINTEASKGTWLSVISLVNECVRCSIISKLKK